MRSASVAGWCWPVEHGRVRRRRLRVLRPTGSSDRARSRAPTSSATLRPRLPAVRRRVGTATDLRAGADRPTKRLRRHQAAPGAPLHGLRSGAWWSVVALRYHNVYGPGMPRDTPYAGVAASFAAPWNREKHRRCSRTAASCVTSCTSRTSLAPTCAPWMPSPTVRAPTTSPPAGPRAWGRWRRRSTEVIGGVAPVVSGRYRLGDVRHVFASPQRAAEQLGFEAMVGFREGMKRFATASLRTGGAE